MPPKSSNDKSAYKNKTKLDLEELNGEIQATEGDLTKISLKELAKRIGVLSEDVNMYMYLSNAKRYHAPNDRTTNLLLKGTVVMSATTGEAGEGDKNTFSDAEAVGTVKKGQEVELFIVDKK